MHVLDDVGRLGCGDGGGGMNTEELFLIADDDQRVARLAGLLARKFRRYGITNPTSATALRIAQTWAVDFVSHAVINGDLEEHTWRPVFHHTLSRLDRIAAYAADLVRMEAAR